MSTLDKYRVNYELVSDKARNAITSTEYLKHGDKWLDKFIDDISEFVTPEMFGAVGDGITDDTDALQNAFNSSKYIKLNNKTYITKRTIKPQSGTFIIGSGANSSIIKAGVGLEDAILLYEKSSVGIVIKDVGFKQLFENENGRCIVLGDGIPDSSHGEGTFISNVVLSDANKDGIIVKNYFWTIVVDGLFCENCGEAGIRVLGSDNIYSNINVEDCRFGIRVEASNNKFSNCKLYVCGQGVYDRNNNDVISSGLYVTGCQRNLFINVEAQDCLNYGFWVVGCNNLGFVNCLSDGNANINSYIPNYDLPNNLFDNCKNMNIHIDNDDYTQRRVNHAWKLNNCKNVIINGGISRITSYNIMANCIDCVDNTHLSELLEKLLNRGVISNSFESLEIVNGTYENYIYTPTSSDYNTSMLKIKVKDGIEKLYFGIDINLPEYTYYRIRLYANNALYKDEDPVIIGDGRRFLGKVIEFPNGSVNNYIMLAFNKVQPYTINGLSVIGNYSGNSEFSTILNVQSLNNVCNVR